MDWTVFKLAGAFLLGMMASFCKQYGLVISLVVIVILFDCATGLIKSKLSGEGWESKKGMLGFWKKMSLLCAMGFGIFLDSFIPLALQIGLDFTLPFNIPIGMIVCVYIILNESISITENLYCCNKNIIPKWIADVLKLAKNSVNSEGEKQNEDKAEVETKTKDDTPDVKGIK